MHRKLFNRVVRSLHPTNIFNNFIRRSHPKLSIHTHDFIESVRKNVARVPISILQPEPYRSDPNDPEEEPPPREPRKRQPPPTYTREPWIQLPASPSRRDVDAYELHESIRQRLIRVEQEATQLRRISKASLKKEIAKQEIHAALTLQKIRMLRGKFIPCDVADAILYGYPRPKVKATELRRTSSIPPEFMFGVGERMEAGEEIGASDEQEVTAILPPPLRTSSPGSYHPYSRPSPKSSRASSVSWPPSEPTLLSEPARSISPQVSDSASRHASPTNKEIEIPLRFSPFHDPPDNTSSFQFQRRCSTDTIYSTTPTLIDEPQAEEMEPTSALKESEWEKPAKRRLVHDKSTSNGRRSIVRPKRIHARRQGLEWFAKVNAEAVLGDGDDR